MPPSDTSDRRPSAVDNWLSELDPAVIEAELDAFAHEGRDVHEQIKTLQTRLDRISAEISKRKQVMELLTKWMPSDASFPAEDESLTEPPPEDEPPAAGSGAESDDLSAGTDEVSDVGQASPENEIARVIYGMEEKEEFLLELLASYPAGLHVQEVRRLLDDRGITFSGTPERGVLWRLQRDGRLTKVRQGVYKLPEPETSGIVPVEQWGR